MDRLYDQLVAEHCNEYPPEHMLFFSGPRQVGKTTTSQKSSTSKKVAHYLNWDNMDDQPLILRGPKALAEKIGLHELQDNHPIIIFDEIHKYPKWKLLLKGFFDTYGKQCHIIVTGSGRLDMFSQGGDSLMGRYIAYRMHPITLGECLHPKLPSVDNLIHSPMKISDEQFNALFNYGGFPKPFLKNSAQFHRQWARHRTHQLFQEDIRDATRVQSLQQLSLLAQLLEQSVGSACNYSSLAKQLRASVDTVREWIILLNRFYYCFSISPWSHNITRSLLKQPKVYMWDWSLVKDPGARLENLVASHLLKAVNTWTDLGHGDFRLHYLRDKEKREVDFIVTRDETPWFLVEVKTSDTHLSPNLTYFQNQTNAQHAFQAVLNMDQTKKSCFESNEPIAVPLKTVLSQLV